MSSGSMLAAAMDVVLPVSGIMLVLYPAGLLLWMALDGRYAAPAATAATTSACPEDPGAEEDCKAKPHRQHGRQPCQSFPATAVVAGTFFGVAPLVLLGGGLGCGFLVNGGGRSPPVLRPTVSSAQEPMVGTASGMALAAGTAAAAAIVAVSRSRRSMPRPAPALRIMPVFAPTAVSSLDVPLKENRPSLWHDVDLFVRNWLDIPTGLLRYVNEMPLGGLTKYEVQPDVPHNVIREDAKGSARLSAFGRPVPFNYGCFPQTFRDPATVDELYGAPGDNDPLDVLDLSSAASAVGSIVNCRPLGAVCLIDEGQADWKILAVNTESSGPLAQAQSVEDVERLAPGRIKECLSWLDDFKQSCGKDTAKLHWEIHGADRAMQLIQTDHTCWKQLVAGVGADGHARGHWIREANPQANAQVNAQVLKFGWEPLSTVPRTQLRAASILAGASRVHELAITARATSASLPRPLSRRPEADGRSA